jgi:DNA-binding CsgD family transcriptional regulator
VLREIPLELAVGPGDLPVPRSYATVVLAQVASCPPAARVLAEALAVLGGAAPIRTAAAVAGLDDASARRAATDLEASGLLVSPRHDGVAFAHGLVRAGVADDLSTTRRAELHAAAALVTRGDARLRHRLAAAVGPDDRLVGEVRRRARELAAGGSLALAASLLLAAAPLSGTRRVREDVVVTAAGHLLAAGQGVGELEGEIVEFAPSPHRSLVLGRNAFLGGRLPEATAWLAGAWRDVAGDPAASHLAAVVADMRALVALDGARWDEVVRWADRALVAGSTSGISATLLAHGLVLGRAGGTEERLGELVDRRGADPAMARDARIGRGMARLWTNDLDGAAHDLTAASATLDASGSLLLRAEVDAYLAEVAFRAGRWDDAVATATTTAAAIDAADAVWLGALAHGVAATVLATRGDEARAGAHLRAARDSAATTGLLAARLWAHQAAIRVAAAIGDHRAVVGLGDLALDEPWGALPEGVHHWRAAYAEALVAAGRIDDAHRVVDVLTTEAAAGDDSVGADAARAAGAIAAATGRADEADAAFRRGLALDAGRSRPFERALLELAAGAHLRRGGARRAGADLLATAGRRLAVLGAAPWSQRCARELEACGLRPRRRRPDEQSGLTARERTVAEHVGRGLSNREVATELGITPKTVEHHLSRVYAKLGVTSRAQLAGRALDGERDEDGDAHRRPAGAVP